MGFQLRTFQQILFDQMAVFLANTPVNDIAPGSVVSSFLEADSKEAAQEYIMMYYIIRNYNLDTTEGDRLDDRASEFGLERLGAKKATGLITISDPAVTLVATKIWAGNKGPVSGQSYIDVENVTGFPASGTVIVGRNTDNVEPVAYTSITNFTNYFRLNLSGSFTNDHGTDETVILAQGGDRPIASGTAVRIPGTDISDEVQFVTTIASVILDGAESVENVPVIAVVAGTTGNAPVNTIKEFVTDPFDDAAVTNPFRFTNGTNRESDASLRERIKDKIQSLSRGTKRALLFGVFGISSTEDNKRVVSANLIEPTITPDIVTLYIDDGAGLEPSFSGVGNEVVLESATGGNNMLQLDFFPLVKAQVETQNSQPYAITNGMSLTVEVNNIAETLNFSAGDYEIEGALTAYEVTQAINDRMSLIEARTTENGSKVEIRAKTNQNETIQVTGGTANAADILNFTTDVIDTLYLYSFDGKELVLLSKDGNTAFIENNANEPYNLTGGETLTVVVDGKSVNTQTITFQNSDFEFPGSATAEEVMARINLELAGAEALSSSNGTKLTLKSKTLNSSTSKIQVTGGSANAELDFSTTEAVGSDFGYTLNRFNGQIRLVTTPSVGTKFEVGTRLTRAFIISNQAQLYNLADGDTITVSVDEGINQVFTFNTADFTNISQATAAEVVAVINETARGFVASVTDNNEVLLTSNTWSSSGSIEVVSVSGQATNLGFTTGLVIESLEPHIAALTSQGSAPFTFVEGDSLIIVIDKNINNNTFTIEMDLDGEITVGDASAPYDTFIGKISSTNQNFNLKFINDNDLKDFTLQWKTGDNAPNTNTISAYNSTTGEFTLNSAESNSIDAADTFILIPTTTKNVVTYFNNTAVTSLSTVAEIQASDDGENVQIASKTVGKEGAVNVTGGDANTELVFSTTQKEGVNGYNYYTGLLQKVQHTVDGLDSNFEVFEGIRAAGVQVEVLHPVVRRITSLEIDVTLKEELLLSSIQEQAKDVASNYINGLGVGDDVILEEIRCAIMQINGVTNVRITNPSGDIAIADNEKAVISVNDIALS